MAGESPFEKKYVDVSAKADLPGVLDQLNLPPTFIEYVRVHQKTIKIVAIVVAIVVVTVALYDTYQKNRLNKSSSALFNSSQITGEERIQSLEKVIADYKGTPASTWAQIELARTDMKNSKFSEAAERYSAIRKNIGTSSPLYPLLTYGVARARELEKKYDQALAEYQMLKGVDGFQEVAVLGMARVYEIKDKKEEALQIYEQYLSTFEGAQEKNPDKILIEEMIARIRATM